MAERSLLVAAVLVTACGSAAPRKHDPCAPPAAAAPSLEATGAWQRPPNEPPLTCIREVGGFVAVCSRDRLHLLRSAAVGSLEQVAVAPLTGCRRLASDGTALAVLQDSSVVDFPAAGSGTLAGPEQIAPPPASHDLALWKGELLMAADDGVHRFTHQSGAWTEQAALGSGTPVRAVAVAGGSAYLGEQGAGQSVIEQVPLAGGKQRSIQFDGLVEHLVVQGDRGVAITGGFGLVTFAAGAAFGAAPHSIDLTGSVSDARVVGDQILAANRVSLVRVGTFAAPVERALLYRSDRGSSSGAWIVGVAADGDGALALGSDGVERVSLAKWTPRPLLVTEKVREDVQDGSRSFLLRVSNRGTADLVLGKVVSDSPDWTAAPSKLDTGSRDANCPARLHVAPGATGLLDVRYLGSAAESKATLTLASNDSDEPALPFPVTRYVPPRLLAVGDPAPDFALPLLGGGEVRLGDLAGHVAYLKFFSPG